jgi:Rrf2 family protein
MKLGSGIEWAIHCCALLGALPPDRSMKVEKLAEFHNLKLAYLRKHFQALSKAGIVTTVTGPQGGYRLSRESDKISLLDIYFALEGNEPAFRCSEIRQDGPCAMPNADYSIPCNIASSMWRAEAAWRKELAQVSIADVLAATAKQLTSEKIERMQQWMTEALA